MLVNLAANNTHLCNRHLVRNGGHVFAGVGLSGCVEIVPLQLGKEEEELLQRIVEVVGHLHNSRCV